MAKRSAGLLMYRWCHGRLEVLLVHPGGPFFRRKDAGAWSIPKGELGEAEAALEAAQREFQEELGLEAAGPFVDLGQIRQRGGKRVQAWAMEGDCDPNAVESQTFEMEWPPRSGQTQRFPEVDQVAFFGLTTARDKIHPNQAAFLDRLLEAIGDQALSENGPRT